MTKKKTSFTLETDLLKNLKMKAVELNTTQTELIEKFIKQGLLAIEKNLNIEELIEDEKGQIILNNIRPDLLKTIKKISKNKNIQEKEVINDMIEKGIKTEMKSKIPEHLIANKDSYNPNSREELKSIFGIIDVPEDFDIVKAVNDVKIRKWDY